MENLWKTLGSLFGSTLVALVQAPSGTPACFILRNFVNSSFAPDAAAGATAGAADANAAALGGSLAEGRPRVAIGAANCTAGAAPFRP